MVTQDESFVERLGLYTLMLSVAIAATIVFLWVAYLPPNPLSPSWSTIQQLNFRQVIPEGWGFFTKSQTEENFLLFKRSASGMWVNAMLGPQAQSHELFGWRRVSRAQGLDVGLISSVVQNSEYETCDSASMYECFQRLPKAHIVANAAAQPLVCGRILLVWRKPVPWRWARFAHVTLRTRVANLDVKCSRST